MLTVGVTGAGGAVGGAILRALKLSKLPTRIICFDTDALAPGLYSVNQSYLVPPASSKDYLDTMLVLCKQEGIDALFIGTEAELMPLSGLAHELTSIECTPICSKFSFYITLRDENGFSELLRNNGFPFMQTAPAQELDELIDSVGFPLVIKPLEPSLNQGRSIVFSREEAESIMSSGKQLACEFLLPEEWGIQKKDLTLDYLLTERANKPDTQLSIQVLIDQQGGILGTLTTSETMLDGVPIVINPIETDESGATELALQAAKFLAPLGLKGPCNFRCTLTADGPVFFSVNPRFTPITSVRAALGFNEVEACLRRLVLGETTSQTVAASLQADYGYICTRYTTEYMIPIESVKEMRRNRKWPSRGWSTHI